MRSPIACFLALLAPVAAADLQPLAEEELQAVDGQAGISLAVDLHINRNPANTRCSGGCGARLTFRPGQSDGYIVLDNIQGRFSFEGVTVDIEHIDSGFNGEGAQFNQQVLKIGLQAATFDQAQITLAGSNQSQPGPGFTQTNLLTYQTSGSVHLQGNVYIFGTP